MLSHAAILDKWRRFVVFLGVTLIAYQVVLAEELLKFPGDANIKQARQTGKSFIMGLLVFFIAYEMRWNIVLTAPVQWQTWAIMEVVHKVKRKVDHKMKSQKKGRLKTQVDNRYELVFAGRGSVRALSGSETASQESASADLVVVDEHQDLTWEYVSEVFGAMLGSSILFHSEKTGGETPFWSCGIGGERTTVAERVDCDFTWELPWQAAHQTLIDTGRENDAAKYKTYVTKRKNTMFPPEFAAHFECKRLDTSEKLLVPEIHAYERLPDGSVITIGFDFGRSVDKTIGTALHQVEALEVYYIEDWLIEQGSFDMQHDRVCDWLKGDKQVWDHVNAEVNGIGHGPTDFLSREFPEVQGINVSTRWKTRNAQKVSRLASNGKLTYNPKSKLAGQFVKDITSLKYNMTNTSEIHVDHSDFLSSLMIAMNEPKWGSVAA